MEVLIVVGWCSFGQAEVASDGRWAAVVLHSLIGQDLEVAHVAQCYPVDQCDRGGGLVSVPNRPIPLYERENIYQKREREKESVSSLFHSSSSGFLLYMYSLLCLSRMSMCVGGVLRSEEK